MEVVKPFVKWAGGKGSLLPQLNKFYPLELKNETIDKYVEPFIGGGAVLINILQKYKVKEAYAFDINIDLINCYNIIKVNVDKLIKELSKKETQFLKLNLEERKKYFYDIRKEYNSYRIKENEQNIKRAVEFIFLNRTCFNGLYRVNKSGDFNVPFGRYKNPTICDADNLRNLSHLIKNVLFQYEDDSLENLNKLAKALNEENVGSLEDLYWKLREGIGTDDTVTQYTRYDDDSDLDQMLAGETPTQIINDLGPKFNLSDSYLYWENGYLNTATEQEFQADLKFMATDLINSFIDKYNSTYEDSISFIN